MTQNNTHHLDISTTEGCPKNGTESDGQDNDAAIHKDGFQTLIRTALQVILESDVRRGEFSGNSDGSSSQGRWLYDPAAQEFQRIMDRLVVCPIRCIDPHPLV